MIKFKTTKREILGDGLPVVAVGYCDLQHLLHDVAPIAYTARREGWACDVYKLENFYLTTGYAPFGKSLDYDFLKKFDDKARAILSSDFGFKGWDDDTYKKRCAARETELTRLLKKFEKRVMQEEGAKWLKF